QQRDRDQACGEDDDRQYRREDRPVDEEPGEVHDVVSLPVAYCIATACAGAGAGAPMAMSCGATGMPGMNTFCTPCTITLSSAARPDSTTRSPSIIRPSTTSLRTALLSAPST